MTLRQRLSCRTAAFAIAIGAAASLGAGPALAEAMILVEADTGKVLHAEQATTPWYPASITKIMTAYVTLRAVKEGRIKLDTLFRVSGTAAAAAPTKMGFPVGTTVTIDNAIKMLMVKSANDIAIVLAEGVGGSVEGFAEQMNQHAARLGMTQSHFVNPHGLPAENQITSARDMAILARTVLREFPEYNHYWSLPGIRMGKRVHRNHNNLMTRYPGIDGMKTGFICASGFNVVATATRNGKRLIAVVLGSQSPAVRAVKAAQLFERGFQVRPLSWLTPGLGQVEALPVTNVDPPNLRDVICGKNRRRPPAEEAEDDTLADAPADSPYAVLLSSLRSNGNSGPVLQDVPMGEPVRVFTGPPSNPSEVMPAEAKGKSKGKATTAKNKGKTEKNKAKTETKAAAKTNASPTEWNTLSPSALAHNPPSELVTTAGGSKQAPASESQPEAKKKAAKKAASKDKSKEKSKERSKENKKAAPKDKKGTTQTTAKATGKKSDQPAQ